MTNEELRREITNGPLKSKLSKLWGDVFGPHPTKTEELKYREGFIKPDAAYAIHEILRKAGRIPEDVSWKRIKTAHDEAR